MLKIAGIDFYENDSTEMMDAVDHINSNPLAQEQLQSLIADVTDPEKRAVLEKAWKDDCANLSEHGQFLKDQQNCRKCCIINLYKFKCSLLLIYCIFIGTGCVGVRD